MEESIVTDTLTALEQQLTELAGRLSAQITALSQQEAARREALDEQEDQLRRREMTAQAYEELKARELPTELAACLVFEDRDALTEGLNALEKAFRAAVQQGVEQRLLTDAPKTGEVKPLSEMSDEEYYAAVCRND